MSDTKIVGETPSKINGKGTPFTELTEDVAKGRMDLIYIETESGFHIAIDATFIDQVRDYVIKLPTGETINTRDLQSN